MNREHYGLNDAKDAEKRGSVPGDESPYGQEQDLSTERKVQDSAHSESTESHFWVGSRPFFETVLFVLSYAEAPRPSTEGEQSGEVDGTTAAATAEHSQSSPLRSQISKSTVKELYIPRKTEVALYDADGEFINQIEVVFPEGEVGMLSLEPFLEAAKLESGFRYGRIKVTSNFPACHRCRLSLHNQFSILEPATLLTAGMGDFFPLAIAPHRSLLLAVMNAGDQEAVVRCKLFCGSRSPETEIIVDPLSSRLLFLDGTGEHGLMKVANPAAVDADKASSNGKASGVAGVAQHFLERRSQIDLSQGYLRAQVASGGPISLQIFDFAESERAELLHVL